MSTQEPRWKATFLEALVHSSLDGILVVDAQGKKILQNQRCNELWKIPPEVADSPDDQQQVRWVTAMTRDPESFAGRIKHLYAHPEEKSRDEKIGFMFDMQYDLLPTTLSAFRKVWPKVTLNLLEMTAAEQIVALHKNRIQIGFVREPGLPSLEGLQSLPVTRSKMMAVVPDTFPLKGKEELRLKDLADRPFISLCEDDYPGTRDWLTNVCRGEGFTPKISHESNNTATLIHLVALEMGVALLPESCLRLPHEGTAFHPLVEEVHSKTYLVWRKKDFSQALQHYISIVSDCFEGQKKPHTKTTSETHPEKKLAKEGMLKEAVA